MRDIDAMERSYKIEVPKLIQSNLDTQMSDEILGQRIEQKVENMKQAFEDKCSEMDEQMKRIYSELMDHHQTLAEDQVRRRKEKADF